MLPLVRGDHVDFKEDAKTIGMGIVGFLAIRFVFLTFLWRPFARWLLMCKSKEELAKSQLGKSADESAKLEEEEKTKGVEVEKLCKYGWHLVAYMVLWIWSLRLMQSEEWSMLNTGSLDSVWDGYPHAGWEKPVLKPFILAEIAWYGHTFIESLMVDKARGDFFMMMIHHVLAVLLLAGSFWANGHRAALTVVFEQDMSDILLYISKMIVKADKRFPVLKSDIIHGVLLILLLIVWWSTRCFLLGMIVYNCYYYVGPSGLIVPWDANMDLPSLLLFLQLAFFFVLQVIWGWNLILVGWRKATSGELHDHYGDADQKKKKGAKGA